MARASEKNKAGKMAKHRRIGITPLIRFDDSLRRHGFAQCRGGTWIETTDNIEPSEEYRPRNRATRPPLIVALDSSKEAQSADCRHRLNCFDALWLGNEGGAQVGAIGLKGTLPAVVLAMPRYC